MGRVWVVCRADSVLFRSATALSVLCAPFYDDFTTISVWFSVFLGNNWNDLLILAAAVPMFQLTRRTGYYYITLLWGRPLLRACTEQFSYFSCGEVCLSYSTYSASLLQQLTVESCVVCNEILQPSSARLSLMFVFQVKMMLATERHICRVTGQCEDIL